MPYAGPLNLLPNFQQGNFIYDDHFPLPPGRYTMEVAIIDRIDGRISVRRSAFAIPAGRPAVALSNLLLVRRIDTNPAPEKSLGPEDDRGRPASVYGRQDSANARFRDVGRAG